MKWCHLPEGGGLYKQNPKLLDRFLMIMQAEAKYEEQEQARRDSENKRKRSRMSSRAR